MGREPFAEYDDGDEVAELVRSGQRPPLPVESGSDASVVAILSLIRKCWDVDPEARPTFARIALKLEKIVSMVRSLFLRSFLFSCCSVMSGVVF